MTLLFVGRQKHPGAFALGRNLGLCLKPGPNEISREQARKLLKVYPNAFKEAKEKTKSKSRFFSAPPLAEETKEENEGG